MCSKKANCIAIELNYMPAIVRNYINSFVDQNKIVDVTPITSAVKALKHLSLKKISVFTPYPQAINEKVISYFKNEKFDIKSFASFNLESDLDIGKIDPNYLFEVLAKMDISDSEALFISCTALPALEIIQELENKIKKTVLSSNQTLIWDSIRQVGYISSIEGYGKLFSNN